MFISQQLKNISYKQKQHQRVSSIITQMKYLDEDETDNTHRGNRIKDLRTFASQHYGAQSSKRRYTKVSKRNSLVDTED